MKHNRTDTIVLIVGALFGLMTLGLVFDIWQLALLSIPVTSTVLIALGCLNRKDEWGPSLRPVLVFGAILTALFFWAGVTMFDDGRLGGLQTPVGVVYYVIWPFITVFSGLLYAFVYGIWLRRDVVNVAGDQPSV